MAEVTNETDLERNSETVEIAWGDLRRAGVTADNVVVTTEEGEQIPSQVIFDSAGEPVTLLFQATVAPAASTSYRIEAGEREAYEPQAYGRYVPERADDYAWENNLVAYRIYGPALADPRTQGRARKAATAKLQQQAPRVRDAIIMLLAGKSYGDVATPDGKVLLKGEVAARLNQILGAQRVIRVYFSSPIFCTTTTS